MSEVPNPVTGQMVLDIEPMVTPEHVNGISIQERFEEFHRLNSWVLTELERMTQEYLDAGRTKVGMKMLVEVLRWNHDLTTKGDPFKLNNIYSSRYARKLIERHPEWEEVFQLRELQTA